MKKLLLALLAVVLLLAACALAEDAPIVYTSGDFQYILLEDGTAEITGYSGKAAELTIPAELDGHTVTSLADSSIAFCRKLITVTIPDTVVSIADHAFASCRKLTTVSIPDSVLFVGANPFASCDMLTDIIVSPDHPTLAIIDGVLFSKTDKTLICYPTTLPDSTYAVPQGICSIGSYAFQNCDSLISITLPDTIVFIDDDAFSACNNLATVNLPDGVTSIGESAFSFCTSLTSLNIPENVTAIGADAFLACSALTITVPRDSYAAQYCKENNLPYTYIDFLDWLLN
ncbi:MAG: leucine-rich repeat domain-containing protein [Clostridia bacterium]|nr:leucine-rich repeat domain-containing protein [Clostridia bacterium]